MWAISLKDLTRNSNPEEITLRIASDANHRVWVRGRERERILEIEKSLIAWSNVHPVTKTTGQKEIECCTVSSSMIYNDADCWSCLVKFAVDKQQVIGRIIKCFLKLQIETWRKCLVTKIGSDGQDFGKLLNSCCFNLRFSFEPKVSVPSSEIFRNFKLEPENRNSQKFRETCSKCIPKCHIVRNSIYRELLVYLGEVQNKIFSEFWKYSNTDKSSKLEFRRPKFKIKMETLEIFELIARFSWENWIENWIENKSILIRRNFL